MRSAADEFSTTTLLATSSTGTRDFPGAGKIRTTHNGQAVETKRFLRTGEARSRSTNIKARGVSDCVATIVVSLLAGSPRSGKPLHLQRFIA